VKQQAKWGPDSWPTWDGPQKLHPVACHAQATQWCAEGLARHGYREIKLNPPVEDVKSIDFHYLDRLFKAGPLLKHHGRQPKVASGINDNGGSMTYHALNDGWGGFRVLKPDFEKILDRFKAHKDLDLQLMVFCVVCPGLVNSAASTSFCKLYSCQPAVFLRVMLQIGNTLENRYRSPKVRAAVLLANSKAAWHLTNAKIADLVKATEKSVEHARRMVRLRLSNIPS
jgi:hypothetical protein